MLRSAARYPLTPLSSIIYEVSYCADHAFHSISMFCQTLKYYLFKGDSGSFPGLHVFPGGLIDKEDIDLADELKIPVEQIAVAREAFEECNIHLFSPPLRIPPDDLDEIRSKLNSKQLSFKSFLNNASTTINQSALTPFTTWITPSFYKKRYATHYFINKSNQKIKVDDKEIVSFKWITPINALEAFRKKEIKLFPPQYYLLDQLSKRRFDDIVERKDVILPQRNMVGSDEYLILPGDGLYDCGLNDGMVPSELKIDEGQRVNGLHRIKTVMETKDEFKELEVIE